MTPNNEALMTRVDNYLRNQRLAVKSDLLPQTQVKRMSVMDRRNPPKLNNQGNLSIFSNYFSPITGAKIPQKFQIRKNNKIVNFVSLPKMNKRISGMIRQPIKLY